MAVLVFLAGTTGTGFIAPDLASVAHKRGMRLFLLKAHLDPGIVADELAREGMAPFKKKPAA